MQRVCVMLPTYNEAATIGQVLTRLRAVLPSATLLVVDDGSPDGTADVVEAHSDDVGEVFVLRRGGKLGLGSAYREGLRWADARGHDIAVAMDSDLSHDPELAPRLVAALQDEQVQLAVGSRYVPDGGIENWSRHRELLSRGGNAYVQRMLGMATRDATSGFRAYRLSGVRTLGIDSFVSEGYTFQIEMVYRVTRAYGPKAVVEVPITFRERAEGESKMSWRIAVEAVRRVTRWGVRDRLGRRGAAVDPTPIDRGGPRHE